MMNIPRERPKAFQELQTYSGSKGEGLHASSWYIYPVDAQWASDAWFAPIIALDNVILWQGEPQENAVSAREEAKKYLALKLKELLNPLASGGSLKSPKKPDQLF